MRIVLRGNKKLRIYKRIKKVCQFQFRSLTAFGGSFFFQNQKYETWHLCWTLIYFINEVVLAVETMATICINENDAFKRVYFTCRAL